MCIVEVLFNRMTMNSDFFEHLPFFDFEFKTVFGFEVIKIFYLVAFRYKANNSTWTILGFFREH